MSDTDPQRSPVEAARQSWSGSRMTDAQFEKAWQLTGVIEREIRHSGSFREALTDYAHAFARSEKFDALRAESDLREIFGARYGKSMSKTRDGLLAREDQVAPSAQDQALRHAQGVCRRITEGETMPFYKAYDDEASRFARDAGITELGAKRMMKDAYQQGEGRDLYEVGKSLEERHHRPRVEAQRLAREQNRQSPSMIYSRG